MALSELAVIAQSQKELSIYRGAPRAVPLCCFDTACREPFPSVLLARVDVNSALSVDICGERDTIGQNIFPKASVIFILKTWVTFFLFLNTKEDILEKVSTVFVCIIKANGIQKIDMNLKYQLPLTGSCTSCDHALLYLFLNVYEFNLMEM